MASSCSSRSSPAFAMPVSSGSASTAAHRSPAGGGVSSSSSLLVRTTVPTPRLSTSSSSLAYGGQAVPMSPSKRKIEVGTGIEERLGRGEKKLREDKGKGRAVAADDSSSGSSSARSHASPDPPAGPCAQSQKQQPDVGSAVASVVQTGHPPGVVVKQLPHDYIAADAEDLVLLIASMLTKLIGHNDQVPLRPEDLTRFHSRSPPGISVVDYLRRIVRYTNIEKSPLLILLPYLDAFCAHLPTFTLSSLTVHRFLISSACVASKAICDSFCTNSHYAKVGGIKVDELNLLERELISGLGWKLNCEASLLQSYYTSLITSYSTSQAVPSPGAEGAQSLLLPQTIYTQAPPAPPPPPKAPPPYLPWPSLESLEGKAV